VAQKTALITGITGQDGSYLAEHLLEQGYRVVGMTRRSSTDVQERIEHIVDRIEIVSGDLLDQSSMTKIVAEVRPEEIYNLAAQSFVPTSWAQPVLTGEVTGLGVMGLVGLEAALSLLEEVGIDAISRQVLALSGYAAEKLDAKGYEVRSPRADYQRAGLVTFRHRSLPNASVLKTLEEANVVAAVRGGNLRFSPHFYNTPDEIDRAADALPA